MSPHDILAFWFDELQPRQHFVKDPAIDKVISERFGKIHAAASRGELHAWRDTPQGRLAEIIVIDQFSRNLFRNDPRAFACDPMALALAQEAVRAGADQELPAAQQAFVYMPYMHSESPLIHALAVELFARPGLEGNLKFEHAHKAIIDRFGRYPHRNAVLGRTSTADETAFLAGPGSSF